MAAAALESFGRAVLPSVNVLQGSDAVERLRAGTLDRSILPFGNGRSYGDSCQNREGYLADMRSADRVLSLDPQGGILEAEAGTMLAEIIDAAAPHGLFPPVVPGTRFVTLGGAIANDVHGKNHHRRGTFGSHVLSLVLLRSDGVVRHCSPTENPELFAATLGGMGLTGIILSARIRLMRVGSLDVLETVTPFRSLDGFFEIVEEADGANEYVVAWIDQLARGAGAGRGMLISGNHAATGSRPEGGSTAFSIPVQPPFSVLGSPFLRLFNAAYAWSKSRIREPSRSGYRSFFFPLDGVRNWNRLYGPRGLHQHQSVVPEDAAREAVPALLRATQDAGQASFLTVLKRFGESRSPGILSFPRKGYTLTLDFPNRGVATERLLRRLDEITLAAGGAVNPYKDARMSADVFEASFPRWTELEKQRDPLFMSDFWRRTAMRLASGRGDPAVAAE